MSSEWAEQAAPDPAAPAGSSSASSASSATPGGAAAAGAQHGVPGRALAAQREAMGWSVEQVADQLKMAVRQVIALEAGDYASLPGPAVVRGFVRAYAKVVKLDAAPLVAMIALDSDSAGDTTPRTVRRDKPASFSEVRFPTNGKRGSGLPLGLIGGVVLLVAAVAGAWQFGLIPAGLLAGGSSTGSSNSGAAAQSGPAAAGAQASVTVLPAPAVTGHIETSLVKPGEELKPLQNPGVPLISVPPPTTIASGSAPVAGTTGAAPAPASTAAPAAPAPAAVAAAAAPQGALVLNVREDSWIDLRSSSGKKLFSGLVKGGTVKAVDVSGPVTLKVGNAGGVDATLRGAAVQLTPIAGGTVAKVNLQ